MIYWSSDKRKIKVFLEDLKNEIKNQKLNKESKIYIERDILFFFILIHIIIILHKIYEKIGKKFHKRQPIINLFQNKSYKRMSFPIDLATKKLKNCKKFKITIKRRSLLGITNLFFKTIFFRNLGLKYFILNLKCFSVFAFNHLFYYFTFIGFSKRHRNLKIIIRYIRDSVVLCFLDSRFTNFLKFKLKNKIVLKISKLWIDKEIVFRYSLNMYNIKIFKNWNIFSPKIFMYNSKKRKPTTIGYPLEIKSRSDSFQFILDRIFKRKRFFNGTLNFHSLTRKMLVKLVPVKSRKNLAFHKYLKITLITNLEMILFLTFQRVEYIT